DLEQWYLKITDYAQELLDGLDTLPGWPERVKQMQRNWIGKSEGAEVVFTLAELDGATPSDTKITVFTTRPDTLFGASFFLLAPEHPMVPELVAGLPQEQAVLELREASRHVSALERQMGDYEKHGCFTGRYVINPINGRVLPVWVADYVLMDYGTGAVMAVPSGDQRDFEFARKYDLPVIPVVLGEDDPLMEELAGVREIVRDNVDWDQAFAAEGVLVQSGEFTGMAGGKHSEAANAIAAWLEERGLGKLSVNFRLRDWLISRQRYWGNPIPAIHCEHCGIVPVPADQLPVTLPQTIDLGAGQTLADIPEFYECTCPVCGAPARRETDTMDTFTCSSWYYLRYTDPKNGELPFGKDVANHWMPVDNYIGGIEHAILHLLYSRFWTRVCRDLGLCDIDEPFVNLLCQGMVKDENGETMSKSKGNVMPPSSVIGPYGADTMRLSILFIAPPEKDFDWDPNAVAGCNRFLKRAWRTVWQLAQGAAEGEVVVANEAEKTLNRELHRTVMRCTQDFDRAQFNTAISAVMEMVNASDDYLKAVEGGERNAALCFKAASDIVRCLAPICPHWSEELWHAQLGQDGSVYNAAWPTFDPEAAKADVVEVVVQVCGKVRTHIDVPRETPAEELQKLGLEAAEKWLEGKQIVKVVAIPGKLVNIVAK
ncbi:MAG: leucine--tRNA ligase, partial [Clostridium lundense]|nr:leucine--tRNA ligase [Clostridium lundense]